MKVRLRLGGLVALAGWMLAAAAWGQVGETLVRLQDPAAGKFPSGKLLLASDGFSALAETGSSSPTRRLPLALTRHTLAP